MTHRSPRGQMSVQGQTEKNSVRANVFRVAPESGPCSMQSALRICATNGPRTVRKQCPVIAFYSCRNCIALLLTAGFNNRAPQGRAADGETLMNPQSLRLISASLLAAITLDVAPALAQNNKPNVVFILADNVGYGDLGPYGGGELRGAPTPRIDELAREGLRLTQYLVEPGCTPSRAALMTGQ